MDSKLKWAAALAAIALIAGGAIPWRMWSEEPARELATLGRAVTGLDARADVRASIRLLPLPAIDFERVTLAAPDGAIVLSVERLRADLRLAALLSGRLEFSAIRLINPALTTTSSGVEDLSGRLRALAAYADSGGARPDVFEIRGGRAEIAGAGATRILERIQASLHWENDEAAAASGSFVTEDEKFSVEALLGNPLELMRGDDSPFTLKIASRLLDLSLNGTASGGARWLLEARIAATSERLRPLLGLLDMNPPLPGRLGRFALSGQLRALPQTALLSDLKLAIDGNAFDGSQPPHERGAPHSVRHSGDAGAGIFKQRSWVGKPPRPGSPGRTTRLEPRAAWRAQPWVVRRRPAHFGRQSTAWPFYNVGRWRSPEAD